MNRDVHRRIPTKNQPLPLKTVTQKKTDMQQTRYSPVDSIINLQRLIGNHAVSSLLQSGKLQETNFPQSRESDRQSVNSKSESRASTDFRLQMQESNTNDNQEIAERRKLLPGFCRGYEFSKNVQDGIVKAMLAFSLSQLNKMLTAGVRFWGHGIPPELESGNNEFDIEYSGLARYIYQLRIIQLDNKLSVENICHELAHAWDHVRVMKSLVSLEKLPTKKRDAVIAGKQKVWSDTALKEMFEDYEKRVPGPELAFDGPSTREGHSKESVRDFYAEGYAVFHGSDDFSKARLLLYAPELYDLLEKEARQNKLRTPDRENLKKIIGEIYNQ